MELGNGNGVSVKKSCSLQLANVLRTPWVCKLRRINLKVWRAEKKLFAPKRARASYANIRDHFIIFFWGGRGRGGEGRGGEGKNKKSLERVNSQLSFAPTQKTATRSEKTRLQYNLYFFQLVCFSPGCITIIYCSKFQQTITNSLPYNMKCFLNKEWDCARDYDQILLVCGGSVALKRFLTFLYFRKHKRVGEVSICTCQTRTQVPFFLASLIWRVKRSGHVPVTSLNCIFSS